MDELSALPTTPVWMDVSLPTYPALDRDLNVDVVVVGGGLTGITATYLLRREGVRVALIERDRLAGADTGHTTSHLTYVTDYRLHELAARFGKDGARAFWQAGASAIDHIEAIVQETGAHCDFKRVPGFLHDSIRDSDRREIERLAKDVELANELGFKAQLIDDTPYVHLPGARFEAQAKFHPRKYLNALLQASGGEGCHIFEHTTLEGVDSKPLTVLANGKRIRCEYLIIATHNPVMGMKGLLGATLFQTKLSLYTSYVLGARLPAGTLPEALFWDTSDPYDYLRVDDHGDSQFAIFGGEDVKTGQEGNVEAVFEKLQARFGTLVPEAKVTHRWMGQVVETDDGLPFIGENASQEFIATGFCGNGFTLGTASALMARDRFLGRENHLFDLFRVDRKPFHGGLWRYMSENLDFPTRLIRDRLKKSTGSVRDLRPGEGRIVTYKGERTAAFRDENGDLSLCSPTCTHLGCVVKWNSADQTWDCPCHGSRFHADGQVLSGPAERPLAKIESKPRSKKPLSKTLPPPAELHPPSDEHTERRS